MTEIWMGLRSVADAVDREGPLRVGPSELIRSMQTRLGLNPFAQQESRQAEGNTHLPGGAASGVLTRAFSDPQGVIAIPG